MTREATNRLLEMIEDGLLDKDNVIMACVKYMSEDDVADMMDANEWSARFSDDEPEDDGMDEDELIEAFWDAHPQFTRVDGQDQNEYPTDVRCAFVDFVDSTCKAGGISDDVAQSATLHD